MIIEIAEKLRMKGNKCKAVKREIFAAINLDP
jgi:hypothetical protein